VRKGTEEEETAAQQRDGKKNSALSRAIPALIYKSATLYSLRRLPQILAPSVPLYPRLHKLRIMASDAERFLKYTSRACPVYTQNKDLAHSSGEGLRLRLADFY